MQKSHLPILYAADVTPLQDPILYQLAYNAASPQRRKRTVCYCFSKDRQLSLGVETLLRYGLRRVGVDASATDIVYSTENKPYLKDNSIFFNLSHSGKWAICAIAGCEVGCDVEKMAPINLKLARVFSAEECEDIYAQPTDEAKLELFYRYWTLKESFMKATGFGVWLPLNEFRILHTESISVVQSVDDRSYSFHVFQKLQGYQCAICCAGRCTADAELRILDIEKLLHDELKL